MFILFKKTTQKKCILWQNYFIIPEADHIILFKLPAKKLVTYLRIFNITQESK